jgi:hypothetical protein
MAEIEELSEMKEAITTYSRRHALLVQRSIEESKRMAVFLSVIMEKEKAEEWHKEFSEIFEEMGETIELIGTTCIKACELALNKIDPM